MTAEERTGAGVRPGLRPGRERVGLVRVPGSKSLAQRHLVCAALARGRTRLRGAPKARDVDELVEALRSAGVEVAACAEGALDVPGAPPGPGAGWEPRRALEVGESGTAARLVSASLALCGRAGARAEIRARGTLLRRRSQPLFASLAAAGVHVEPLGAPGGWPVRLTAIGPPSDVALEHPVSSQEVSALALALCARPDEIRLHVRGPIPSRPYLDMTIAVLALYGARVREQPASGPRAASTFHLRGPLLAPPEPQIIEPDASAAAVVLAAACLADGDLGVPGFARERESAQGDVRVVEHLAAFGCRTSFVEGTLRAAGAPTRGARLDLSGEPDLAPPLAAVAAGAAARGHASELTGLATLPRKESSRIEVLAEGLRRCGLQARAGPESLSIGPGAPSLEAFVLDPRGDHRMAFAFALLGLLCPALRVAQPDCVAKSWPSFWEDLGP